MTCVMKLALILFSAVLSVCDCAAMEKVRTNIGDKIFSVCVLRLGPCWFGAQLAYASLMFKCVTCVVCFLTLVMTLLQQRCPVQDRCCLGDSGE